MKRTLLFLHALFALILFVARLPPVAQADTSVPLLPGTYSTVHAGPGDQVDPHIDGNLVTYTSDDQQGTLTVRYFDFTTSTDAGVPASGQGFLPDVSGTRIAFTDVIAGGYNIVVFDTASNSTFTIPGGGRRVAPSIGGNVAAFEDRSFHSNSNESEIVVYDLASGATTRLTDDTLMDRDPVVSPAGDVVVFTKCQTTGVGCDIYQAVRTAPGTFTVTAVTGAEGEEAWADTNGEVVVYSTRRGGETDIAFKPVAGGAETVLALAGVQYNPSIAGNLVSFLSWTPEGNYDVFVYNLSTSALYRLTQTPMDEVLNDITVWNGQARVVYSAPGAEGDFDVFAFTFTIPSQNQPPAIAITTPADGAVFSLGQVVIADYACQDAAGGSGLASCDGPVPSGSAIDTTAVGAHAFTVNAADHAGNQSTLTHTYSVVYNASFGDNFGAPISSPPTLNELKAGGSVPVKFDLGGDFGLDILADGYPTSHGVACDNNAPVEDVDEETTTSPSGLQYDADSGQYVYVWKTQKSWAGTCRQFTLRLADGTDHVALFKFK